MYEDVQKLLVPGFLSTTIELEGHRFSLRSLSQGDLAFLRHCVRDNDPAWRYHLVAHSLWMVDGIPLLESKGLAHRAALDHVMRADKTLIRVMIGTAYGFYTRMREAQFFLEPYLYEEESRRMWRGLSNGQHPLHTKAAIPGVEKLGLNLIQSSWTSWNRLEDEREAQEYIWSNTKVMVSLQSYKGYEKLHSRDQSRKQSEDERRQNVIDRARNRFLYGPDATTETPRGESVRKARTNEELEDEMRRWIAGDLDDHDQIVEAYKNRIRDEQEERERQKEALLKELRAKREQEEQTLGVPKPLLRPITPEEMAAIRAGQPTSGAKFIVEADPVSRTFNRYLRPTVQAGNLSVDATGKIVEKAPDVAAPAQSLDEQIAARKVVLDADQTQG
jgi:hypothetical protein